LYNFGNLAPGSYKICGVIPKDYKASSANQTSDSSDSDGRSVLLAENLSLEFAAENLGFFVTGIIGADHMLMMPLCVRNATDFGVAGRSSRESGVTLRNVSLLANPKCCNGDTVLDAA